VGEKCLLVTLRITISNIDVDKSFADDLNNDRLARTLLSAVPTGVAHRRCVAFHANVVNALYHSSSADDKY
jgi:hypothetical protein